MSLYFDRHAEPINSSTWAGLCARDGYHAVMHTAIAGKARVSTVWLGIDHGNGGGAPLIFETMVLDGEWDQSCWRYSSEAEARAGHDRVVRALLAGVSPEDCDTAAVGTQRQDGAA